MKTISIHKNTFTRIALTLLVVLTMTLTASATDFITDVMVAGHSNQSSFNTLIQDLQGQGWTDISQDLNQGCGSSSYYIHLLYKTQNSSGNTGVPITDFYVRTGANPPDNLTYGGRTYYLVPCQGNDNFTSGHGDLNAGCGSSSDYIFLYYTKDALSNNTGVTAITFNTTQSGAVGSNGGTTGYDLNSGAHGSYIYMHLTTASGGNVVTLSSGSGNVALQNGHILTGTGGTETQVTIADGATVTFNGVNNTAIPNNSSHPWPGISCLGNATIVLNGSTTNSVKGGRGGSGIHIAANKTLTIQGSGTLNATGGYHGAGIGSGWGSSCGNITISGGTITATGGDDSAGIGSGYSQSSCGNITISGGTVTATGGTSAAGIGSGYYNSSCGNITITNGVTRITATKGQSSNNAVGAGNSSTCGTVTIGGVQTGNIMLSPFVTYPYTVSFNANGGTGTMNNQSFMYNVAQNLTANAFSNTGRQFLGWATSAIGPKVYNNGQSVSNLTSTYGATVTLYAKWGNTVTLTSQIGEVLLQDGDTLTGTGGQSTHVKIADGATVTFNGVDITDINSSNLWPGISCLGDAVIVLNGGTTNSVKGGNLSSGIYIAANKALTIQGNGTLNATGNIFAAGIGSGKNSACGNIIISGGTVTATGGQYAAGIGSGYNNSSCGNITITNGVTRVTATKGSNSPNAIGAGNGSTCGTVTIGDVQTGHITMSPFVTYPYTVSFDSNGGTGSMADMSFMYNVAQNLTANAFSNTGRQFLGWATSATGPKVYNNGQNVSNLIQNSGTTVTLYAKWGNTVTLTLQIGEMLLQDGDTLTGMGGQNTHVKIADGATVTFNGVDITTITSDINHKWPGISCLGNAVIVLADNTTNSVKGGYQCSGIHIPQGKTLTIQGNGTLNATGSEYAAGIGGGNNASCGNITIANSVAMVTSTKGDGCDNAIGAGYNSTCGTVTIGGVQTGNITMSPFTTFPYTVAFDANGGIYINTPIDIDFEDGTMGNWTQIDADGDGNIWRLQSEFKNNSSGHNNSGDYIFSQSFDNNLGILTPDNYFVSPQTTLGGVFTFWACAQDASWPDEHFGVAISTTGNTSASDFTTIQEWTMTAKSYGQPTDATRSGNRGQGTWYQYTVDLSSYAGQTGFIAIRHFNCTDCFWLDVDDITYTFGSNVIAVGDQVFMYNVAQNLFPNLFSRPGFAFEGWAITADGPKVYDNQQSVINLTETPGDTVTLYAKWRSHLVTLTQESENVILYNGDTLTGTGGSNTHVSIDYGAMVTFSDADLTAIANDNNHQWPGITCLGNAVIVLADNTTNSVKGGYQCSGIHIPQGKTLTIQGNGTLNATGSEYAAGIGGGNNASCGNITIANSVAMVTATKGEGCDNAIGAGYNSTCGTVTIGGVQTGNITMSPFVTYPYTVAFDANGGTGTMANQSFMYNVAQNLTANALTNLGYLFDGWATSINGPKMYDNQQSVINLTETPGNTVTLYAKWHVVPAPTGLTCTSVTSTTATLTWSSEAASWQIMLNNDEQNLIDANVKPFILTGLAPNTTYTVKVRGIIDGTYSDWSDSCSFTTTEWQVVPAPTGLTCTSVTSTTATLTWSSEAASWQIMLNNDGQNLIDANVKPFILTGLAPNTTYTVKVRVLSSGTYSDWSDSHSFTTNEQGQQALPYAYGFENNNLSADGWILQGASRSCTGIHNALAHTGSYLLRISFSEHGVYLVSPVFTGGDDGIYMSFYYSEYDNMYGSEKFQVGYTTDETVTDPSNFTYGEVVTADTHWQQYSQIFPAGTKRIAIKYIYTRSWFLFLDDFLFKVPGEVSSFDLPITAYTDNGGYHLIASPIAAPITPNAENGFITTGTFDLYRFNQAANLEWENWKAEGTGNFHFNLESGRGYLYANQGGTTLTFIGTPYTGNGMVALTKTAGAQLEGWNLIGNPSATEKTIAKPFYRMNSLGTEIIAAENNIVDAMEGIFVVAETDGEIVTFAEVSRENGQGDERIVLNLSGPSTGSETAGSTAAVIDRAVVRFGEGPTLPKSQISHNSTKIYIPQDGKDYALVNVGRDSGHTLSTMDVHFKAAENGTYTLTTNTDKAGMSYLHLIDSLTSTDVDLLVTPTYTFTATTHDNASRFRLVFNVSAERQEEPE